MNRTRFLRNILGVGLLSTLGCRVDGKSKSASIFDEANLLAQSEATDGMRKELIAAWNRSEIMTMTNVVQMPPEVFTFKYTDEAMSYSEQWRHCVIYTCGQLASRAGIKNPYEKVKLPVQMTKESVIEELKKMYAFVRKSIVEMPREKLFSNCEFAGDTIPVWRLFYAMENHIVHHRGQCVVYLRLNGVIPKGYYGW